MMPSDQFENLVRNLYSQGPAYVFAKDPKEIASEFGFKEVARLASNENPLGSSSFAIKNAEIALKGMNRYPDTTQSAFIQALREYHGNYHFVTGVGMDGVIETCIRIFVNPGDLVTIVTPTFSFYALAALAQGAEVKNVPRQKDFSLDIHAFIKEAKDAKISFLCTPNNPTGTITSVHDIETILNEIKGILFLDNAYVEFSDEDYRNLMKKYRNIIIGRTLSKVFGLAGCRIGYAFVPEWFCPIYQKAATPFTLNTISAAAAIGALQDKEFVKKSIHFTRTWRETIIKESPKPVFQSGANFIMIDVTPHTSDEATEFLAQNGVLVRSCKSFPGIADHYIRVCIGEEWENNRFLEVLKKL